MTKKEKSTREKAETILFAIFAICFTALPVLMGVSFIIHSQTLLYMAVIDLTFAVLIGLIMMILQIIII
jgi:hypothetical protein